MFNQSVIETQQVLAENLAHLRQCLSTLDELLRMAVANARAAGFTEGEYQGMYVDDHEIDRHLANSPGAGLWQTAQTPFDVLPWRLDQEHSREQLTALEQTVAPDHPFRFLRLVQAFNLSWSERTLLLIALAPEIDRRYERLYSFLQDDVTRRRPTVDLALNLLADSFEDRIEAWRYLTSKAPLIYFDLLSTYADAAQREPTYLAHFLKVDPRIVNFVLGHDVIDPRVSMAVQRFEPSLTLDSLVITDERREALRSALAVQPIFYFYGTYGAGMRETALGLCGSLGKPLIIADIARLKAHATDTLNAAPSLDRFEALMRLVFREARLAGGGLLLENWISVLDDRHAAPEWLMQMVIDSPHAIILSGAEAWEPHAIDRERPILRSEFGVPEFEERRSYWQSHVGNAEHDTTIAANDISELANKFRLTGGQIRDAVRTARDYAAWRGAAQVTTADLYLGSRAQSNRKLSNLAEKIPARYGWSDIVLPAERLQQLREICNQVQYGHRVYDEWGFNRKLANARGLAALFAGVSGTGKTMSADVISHELGLDLYKIDLSTVVSKYIGETEKNLSAIFDEATQSNAILFFDEADALFGKRSEVKDSHDRYANIETGYLLQRMESYDGITILATNLRQNLDEAFTRRLDYLIDFPFPEAPDRLRIWQVTFPPETPLAADVDLKDLAERYRLSGGNIRNAVMAAAFLAASDGSQAVGVRHIVHAIKREYQKMGKLVADDLLAKYGELD